MRSHFKTARMNFSMLVLTMSKASYAWSISHKISRELLHPPRHHVCYYYNSNNGRLLDMPCILQGEPICSCRIMLHPRK